MRIVVGISGSTGVIYGVRVLEALKACGVETHLVISDSAKRNLLLETDYGIEYVEGLADRVHDFRDLAAPISSGSFRTDGMIIAPCSIKTLSAVAHSYNDNLLVRAADVALKERRKLVLVVRETPLHAGHLRLMLSLAEMGAIILPPMPAFYHFPKSIDDIINQTVGKALDQFGIDARLFRRWEGAPKAEQIEAPPGS